MTLLILFEFLFSVYFMKSYISFRILFCSIQERKKTSAPQWVRTLLLNFISNKNGNREKILNYINVKKIINYSIKRR